MSKYLDFKRKELAIDQRISDYNRKMSEQIARDTEEFLARGGQIEVVGPQSVIEFETYRVLNDRLSAMDQARKRYNTRGKKNG